MAASGTVFTHYDPEKELRLATDSSAYGLGCVVPHVMPDGSDRATAFASRTLNDAEKGYSQTHKKILLDCVGFEEVPVLSGRSSIHVIDLPQAAYNNISPS